MESPLAAVLPLPRLRLSRNGPPHDMADAGTSVQRSTPASAVEFSEGYNDDDDQQPTPRMTPAATILAGVDTPAARLRALLSRVPTSSKPPPMPSSASEIESDFDPPDTPSVPRETLKDIFSRALREPGNTPQKDKTRWRRNSIDVSEVDATPRLQQENGKLKGKRRSLSDEEVDSPSKARHSETSFKSSQAMTFDMLRERLLTSHSQLKDQHFSDLLYDHVDSNESFLRNITSPTSPPKATSTPQQSLRISVDSSFPSQSNLLDRDSEMHRAIEDVSSYEGYTSHNGPAPMPSPKIFNSQEVSPFAQAPQPLQSSSPPSRSQLTTSKKTHNSVPTARGNGESRSSSRMSLSEMSTSAHDEKDYIHERERAWNKHKPLSRSHTPELKQGPSHGIPSNSGSPTVAVRGTSSRGGSSSFSNFDGESSKRSSIAFPAEYDERSKEAEKDHHTERERDLNKIHALLSRPTSSLDFHSHSGTNGLAHRTREHSSRPQMSLASHRPSRHHSFSNTTRASSPAGSSSASHSAKEESQEEDIIYERERNWNAPQQKWGPHRYDPSSPSRVPSSPSAPSHLRAYPNGRTSAESPTKTTTTTKGEQLQTMKETSVADASDTSGRRRALLSPSTILSEKTSPASASSQRSISHEQSEAHLRARSSPSHGKERNEGRPPIIMLPSTAHEIALTSSAASTSNLNLEDFKLSHNRMFSPHLELERQISTGPESIRTAYPTHDAGANDRTPDHYIRTKLSGRDRGVFPNPMNGHADKPLEVPHVEEPKSGKTLPRESSPAINDHRQEEETPVDKYDGNESLSEERTHEVRPIPPPTIVSKNTSSWTPSPSPMRRMPVHGESQLQKGANRGTPSTASFVDTSTSALLGEASSTTSPSPSPPQLPVHSVVSTPPPSFIYKLQTPSSPKGMSGLSGRSLPPSGGEDGQVQMPPIQLSRNGTGPDLSAIQTPRPPGAWSSTPHDEESVQGLLAPNSDASNETEPGTPIAPPSRVLSMPTRTPAPPGAWMVTPAARRPLQKVRFDTHDSHMDYSSTGQNADPSKLSEGSPQAPSQSNKDVITEVPEEPPAQDEESQLRREPPAIPMSPRSRSSNPSRKSPSIRVVDEFGREQLPEDTTAGGPIKTHSPIRRRNSIRILDAMGRDVDGSVVSSEKVDEIDQQVAPLKHHEALTRVRQGLSDLARGLDDMDRTPNEFQVDARLHELNDASQVARSTRERLFSAEANVRVKLETLRASMKNGFPLAAAVDRRRHFRVSSRIWWGILFLQLCIVFVTYRISMARAKDLFLTTYYDPFYAEIHIYTSRPDTLRRNMFSPSRTPWPSVLDTLFHEGWKASAVQLQNNMAIIVGDWQRQFWENWGIDGGQQTAVWPPT